MITFKTLKVVCRFALPDSLSKNCNQHCTHLKNTMARCNENECPLITQVAYEYFISGTYYLNGESFVYGECITLNYKITQRDMDDVVLELRHKLKTTATIYITNFILTKTITAEENV